MVGTSRSRTVGGFARQVGLARQGPRHRAGKAISGQRSARRDPHRLVDDLREGHAPHRLHARATHHADCGGGIVDRLEEDLRFRFARQRSRDRKRIAHPGDSRRRIGGDQLFQNETRAAFQLRVPAQLRVGRDQLQLARAARNGAREQDHFSIAQAGLAAPRVEREIDQIAHPLANRGGARQQALRFGLDVKSGMARLQTRRALGLKFALPTDLCAQHEVCVIGQVDQIGIGRLLRHGCRLPGSVLRVRGNCDAYRPDRECGESSDNDRPQELQCALRY